MKIYVDVITNDEMLCDKDQVLQVAHGVVYAVQGKYVTLGQENFGISSNVDEDAAEGATGDGDESQAVRVVDVVHENRLVETGFDKKSYTAVIKGYMKTILDRLDESKKDAFKTGAQAFVKEVIANFDEYQFFYGPTSNPEGMIALAKWEGETATFYFWKDGLRAEKV